MLDPFQKKAAFSKSRDLLIAAPAGSGKTRVLVERATWLVREQGLKPERLLVMTFAHKAASELRARLGAAGLSTVSAQTFHAWAYGLARQIHTHPFTLVSDEQRRVVLRKILINLLQDNFLKKETQKSVKRLNWSLTYLARELIRSLEVLSQFGWTAQAALQSVRTRKIKWPFNDLLMGVWRNYERLLEARSVFDFNSLINFAIDFLQEHPGKLISLQRGIDHFLVDEVQDSNQAELALLKMLRGPDNAVTYIGDFNQAIYAWRGAKRTRMGQQSLALKKNYRSDKNIVGLVNNFLGSNIGAEKKGERRPVCIRHERYQELEVLRRLVPELNALGYVNGEILVLARAHNPLKQIRAVLEEFPGLRLSTVHAVKGLEARVVILINCSADRFGFPLPARPDQSPVLTQLASYDQAAEERRIFYVALTRARERLILLTDNSRPSAYLAKIKKKLLKNVTFN